MSKQEFIATIKLMEFTYLNTYKLVLINRDLDITVNLTISDSGISVYINSCYLTSFDQALEELIRRAEI